MAGQCVGRVRHFPRGVRLSATLFVAHRRTLDWEQLRDQVMRPRSGSGSLKRERSWKIALVWI